MVKEVVDQEAIKMVNGRMRSWSTSHWDEGYSLFLLFGPKTHGEFIIVPSIQANELKQLLYKSVTQSE